MEFSTLNPFVRTAGIYEVLNKTGDCLAYDSRIIYMFSGDLTVSIDGAKPSHLTPASLLFIPAGTKYRLKGQYFKAAVITFDPTAERADIKDRIPPVTPSEFDESLCYTTALAPFDRVIRVDDMEGERDTFIKIDEIATSAEGEWRAVISAMLKIILLKVAGAVSDTSLPVGMAEALDEYIRENRKDEISNTEIGAIFGYHPFYVSRMLKERKGITLRQYIIAYRLKAAKRLLQLTRMTMAEIADEVGFTDASYFTKTFRQAFGMTPKEWRNKFKEDFI
jgi:AraC-like DNA-binding protein